MFKKLLEAMKRLFPKWLEGFQTDGVADEALPDLMGKVIAGNRDRATAALAAVDVKESAKFSGLAQGIKGFVTLLGLVTEQKVDDAVKMVEAWASALAPQSGASMPVIESLWLSWPAAPAPAAVPHPTPAPGGNADPELRKVVEAQAEQIRKLSNEGVITNALMSSGLPIPGQNRIRQLFANQVATPEKVQEAIVVEKDYIGKLVGGSQPSSVGNPGGRVEITQEKRDKYGKAMLGMLTGKKVGDVHPFVSLHESFRLMTGYSGNKSDMARKIMINMAASLPAAPGHEEEFEKHHQNLKESVGGFGAILKEALATTDWPQVFGDSVRRALLAIYGQPQFDMWRPLVSSIVPLQDFRTNRRVRLGGFADLATVGELGTYQPFTTPDDEEATYAAAKRGNIFELSFESIVNDDLGALRQLPQRLGIAAARTLSKFVIKTNLSDNPTLYDSVILIHASHSNNGSTALSDSTLQTAITQMRKQTELTSGERLWITPKYLVVPPDLERTAWELCNSMVKIITNDNATTPNSVREKYAITPIINNWQTDTNDWFLVADPASCPTIELGFLGGREEPEIFVQDAANLGSVLTADKVTWKIRHIYGGAVVDYRGFAGAIV